jgi:hypothetical protein
MQLLRLGVKESLFKTLLVVIRIIALNMDYTVPITAKSSIRQH